ncbi:hypothetical protein V5F34_08470 [Xanthobacter autotrophicus]|uniref:hypothetical protein n=1 Tax=Xanthobacter autotrophicus TaxID=280 RepID=UPI003726E976
MTPAVAIASLDRQLAAHGEDVILRRYTGVGQARTSTDDTVRAFVRDYRSDEIVGGIAQGDTEVALSPTGVLAGGLPKRGDQVIIDGSVRTIQGAPPVIINGTVVRINLQVRG